ncbi:MAG: rubrerythrin family protein [Eubacteriaceae bacterium]|nr:rubrerythrin family protein [Eubacteriaceae bacterium]
MSFNDSDTFYNLLAAFMEESKVRNKYEFYAERAESDGLYVLKDIFQKTADNEKEHAKLWYKALNDQEILSEPENLIEAAKQEHYEHDVIYANYAAKALEEGYIDIAHKFEMVAQIEKLHAQRFEQYLEEFRSGTLFSKTNETNWICTKCGYETMSMEAPMVCPICEHSKGYFQVAYNQGQQTKGSPTSKANKGN